MRLIPPVARQSPWLSCLAPAPRLGRGHEDGRVRVAGAGGSILLVLGALVSLVLQSRLGEKEHFLPGTSLRQGPSGAVLGMGRLVSQQDWLQGASHLFLPSTRYSVNPTSAVTAAPSATRSQKDVAPSSTAFKWGKVAAVASLVYTAELGGPWPWQEKRKGGGRQCL